MVCLYLNFSLSHFLLILNDSLLQSMLSVVFLWSLVFFKLKTLPFLFCETNLYSFQAFNVLRYAIGQRYQSHYDAFDPAQYGPQRSQRVCMNLIWQ